MLSLLDVSNYVVSYQCIMLKAAEILHNNLLIMAAYAEILLPGVLLRKSVPRCRLVPLRILDTYF
jgi:hypothetical protein